MGSLLMHPSAALFAGAVLVALLRGAPRSAFAVLAPAVALYLAFQLESGAHWQGEFLGMSIAPFAVDALSRLFAIIFSLMAFAGALFGLNQERRLELPAAFVYAGSAIGVTLAGDLVTVFVFWEAMAIGSTLVLWSAGSELAYRASLRYLMVHLFGGMLLFAGVTGHVLDSGTTTFAAMELGTVWQGLILAAFLVNAAAWPLSAWLPDAYPEASWSGMVFLSAFTTKTAVYVLLRGFPGTELLVYVGLVMVFYGILYALLENDMRRILAYSIVNQVGFMITGIGIGTEIALNGAAAHAFTHILYKALLLMSAGSVLFVTGRRKCTDLGGLYRSMPLTAACGIIGALAISAFPLTSGFVSKSMIGQAAADGHLFIVWMLLAAASAGVFLHAGIKFPWFVFFQKDSGLRPPEPPWNMRAAMVLVSALCIGLGIFYEPLYGLLPYRVNYEPYTGFHVVSQLQLLLFSGLAFFVMLGWLRRTLTISLDVDWTYRVLFPAILRRIGAVLERGLRAGSALSIAAARGLERWARYLHGPQGPLGRTWASGAMGLGVMLMLLGFLLSYYLV
ncbi:MAG TPA: Na(+)/H(+) antiporter subunit D [Burkholderiales bacterium]|nr:Na(+)/H(+) antiporter subunit D [Burkholderiales bacterium]